MTPESRPSIKMSIIFFLKSIFFNLLKMVVKTVEVFIWYYIYIYNKTNMVLTTFLTTLYYLNNL